ncbi:hypothetical protein ACHAXS_009129 [Conticribra weissflogii]
MPVRMDETEATTSYDRHCFGVATLALSESLVFSCQFLSRLRQRHPLRFYPKNRN